MNILRLKGLIYKESLQIIRDPSSLLIAVVLPIMLLFLYGFGVSLDLNLLKIGVCLEDSSEEAQNFLHSLQSSKFFDVTVERFRPPLYELLQKGQIRGICVIPSYFSSFLQNSDLVAPIQVIADGSEANTANFVQYYIQGAFDLWKKQQNFNANFLESKTVLIPRFWFNEQLESRFFLLPGSLAIIMTLIGSLLTALVVAREWERGTMESLISTEVSKLELVIGKTAPYFVLGLISMAICVLVTLALFDVPLRGSLILVFISSAAFLLCSLSVGLLISIITKVQMVACQIAIVSAFLPAYVLSGFLFEISSMPEWIRWLTFLMPARYFVQILQTLFMTGNVYNIIIPNMLCMLIFGGSIFLISYKKMQKRLTQ